MQTCKPSAKQCHSNVLLLSALGMGVSCTLWDLANLPEPCPITHSNVLTVPFVTARQARGRLRSQGTVVPNVLSATLAPVMPSAWPACATVAQLMKPSIFSSLAAPST